MQLAQLFLVLFAVTLTACSTPKVFEASTADFATATVAVSDTSKALMNSTNTTELRVMLSNARYGFGYFDGSKVSQTLISAADLKAREAAIDTLIAFARSLEKIAAPDNQVLGENFKKEVLGLSASAQSLEAAVGNMRQSSTEGLQKKTGAIGSLVASLGDALTQEVQTVAMVNAVLDSADAIEQISNALSNDMELVFINLRSAQINIIADAGEAFNVKACADPNADKGSNTCKAITNACRGENRHKLNYCAYFSRRDHKPWPQNEREELAAAIGLMAGNLVAIDQSAGVYDATLNGFNKTLHSLVKVAKNVENPQSLAVFASELGSFLSQAATLKSEVRAVIDAFKKPMS